MTGRTGSVENGGSWRRKSGWSQRSFDCLATLSTAGERNSKWSLYTYSYRSPTLRMDRSYTWGHSQQSDIDNTKKSSNLILGVHEGYFMYLLTFNSYSHPFYTCTVGGGSCFSFYSPWLVVIDQWAVQSRLPLHLVHSRPPQQTMVVLMTQCQWGGRGIPVLVGRWWLALPLRQL